MLTVAEAEDSRINRISGVCAGSSDWYQLLNDATRQLMRRGNWWGTIKVMQGCIYDGCLTFPRAVGTVLALNRCGSSIPPKNQWFSFNAVLPEHVRHWNACGSFPCAKDLTLVDRGTTSVFNPIPCLNARYVQIYITDLNDVGKTITIFGIDGNGQEIITTRSDGTTQPGLVMTMAIPFVQTPILIRRIDRVIKDPTSHAVYLYQFDGANMFSLAVYEPSETLPEYRTSKIQSSGCANNCNQWPSQIDVFVKLKFIKAARPDDLILINNLDALAMAMQAVKLNDAYDSQGSETMMARAIHEMNLDLRDKLPIDQIPVNFSPQGTAHLSRRKIGLIT